MCVHDIADGLLYGSRSHGHWFHALFVAINAAGVAGESRQNGVPLIPFTVLLFSKDSKHGHNSIIKSAFVLAFRHQKKLPDQSVIAFPGPAPPGQFRFQTLPGQRVTHKIPPFVSKGQRELGRDIDDTVKKPDRR